MCSDPGCWEPLSPLKEMPVVSVDATKSASIALFDALELVTAVVRGDVTWKRTLDFPAWTGW